MRIVRTPVLLIGVVLLSACQGEQSALHPAADESRHVAQLFWVMTIGAGLIWLVVIGTAVYAVLGRNKPTTERFADRFILVGGVIFPTIVLAALLLFGLRLLPDWRAAERADLRIHVTGEQFWWRITYETAEGRVETANELHLPRGKVVEFVLSAHDVIHSFWIPPLGGKLDMIPGRTNLLRLTAGETGTFRGVCAEYCGLSHALMAFPVTVHEPDAFADWLAAESATAARGLDAGEFRRAGCGACHAVRGIVTEGSVGPDLTHLMRRRMLAAGTLPMTETALAVWLADPQAIKPDARMPGYADLPQDQREAILNFLTGLQ